MSGNNSSIYKRRLIGFNVEVPLAIFHGMVSEALCRQAEENNCCVEESEGSTSEGSSEYESGGSGSSGHESGGSDGFNPGPPVEIIINPACGCPIGTLFDTNMRVQFSEMTSGAVGIQEESFVITFEGEYTLTVGPTWSGFFQGVNGRCKFKLMLGSDSPIVAGGHVYEENGEDHIQLVTNHLDCGTVLGCKPFEMRFSRNVLNYNTTFTNGPFGGFTVTIWGT